MKIFVGSQLSHSILIKVLAHTIRGHSSKPVEVIPLHLVEGNRHSMPRDPDNWPGTPFSFQRFLIPKALNYSETGLYLDSDMIVFSDIAELFALDLDEHEVALPDDFEEIKFTSVMLINAKKCQWDLEEIIRDLDEGKYAYEDLMKELVIAPRKTFFSRAWNSLDLHDEGTKLLHYTRMDMQPWLSTRNPLAHFWFEALFATLDAGELTSSDIDEAIAQRYLRPSADYQLRKRIADPAKLPPEVIAGDREFFEYCKSNQWNNMEGAYRKPSNPAKPVRNN